MPGRRGFSLIELLVVIAIVALLMSILLPALAEARRSARRVVCMSNMQQIGRAMNGYSADFKGFLSAFNGLAEQRNDVEFGRLYHFNSQATKEILQRDPQAVNRVLTFSPSSGKDIVAVTETHSHLVLADYLGGSAIMPAAACPEDRARLTWQKLGPTKILVSQEYKPRLFRATENTNITWFPYSASYRLSPACFLPDVPKITASGGSREGLYTNGATHGRISYGKAEALGRRFLSDVAFPAQKVAFADDFQRHFDKQDLYFAYARAKQPLLLCDGSVSVRQTRESNFGWSRADYTLNSTAAFVYEPDPGYEPPVPIEGAKINAGFYKWTRGGLRGVDFGGTEIRTEHW